MKLNKYLQNNEGIIVSKDLVSRIDLFLNESSFFNVTINWKGELHNYTQISASSEADAIRKCIGGLSKKFNRTFSSIKRELKGNSIKVEKV